jgi:DNA invertase Pin-like site-specific DNA recombinase
MLPKRHKLLQHTTRFGCRDHGIGLYLHTEGIDTSSASFALLDIIAAYRPARLSEAIRGEQAKSVAAGKRIGRPIVPPGVEDRTHKALADGRGIRLTARQFNVSPASVINIRQDMTAD